MERAAKKWNGQLKKVHTGSVSQGGQTREQFAAGRTAPEPTLARVGLGPTDPRDGYWDEWF